MTGSPQIGATPAPRKRPLATLDIHRRKALQMTPPAPAPLRDRLRRLGVALRDDGGAVTAEYAIVIMAAVSFAGVLVTILRSGAVQGILTDLVRTALSVG